MCLAESESVDPTTTCNATNMDQIVTNIFRTLCKYDIFQIYFKIVTMATNMSHFSLIFT